jgi:putative protease
MGYEIPIYASTYLASLNYEAVDFLKKLEVERVILERQVSIKEINEIAKRSEDVEIEVFIHGSGCSHINFSCYGCFIPGSLLMRSLFRYPSRELTPMCRFTYEIFEQDSEKKEKIVDAPILDAYTGCSLCKLVSLIKTGVAGLKIVGRCMPPEYQENTTRVYRRLVDLIEQNKLELYYEELEKVKSKNELEPEFEWLYCEQERCFYSPFFHAPYKKPRSEKKYFT